MSSSIEHALIMAAGRGNRMRPLTDIMPKAMVPHNDGTLIGNTLHKLQDKIPNIHITVGYKSALLSQYILNFGINTIFNTDGESNSWWIHNTLMCHLDKPVLVLTCDNITEFDFNFLSSEYFAADSPACMIIPVLPIPNIAGDFITHDNGFVTSLQRETPTDIYCSGIQIINPAKVALITKKGDSFYSIWDQLLQQRQLRISKVYTKKWFSVDTLEQLADMDSQSTI